MACGWRVDLPGTNAEVDVSEKLEHATALCKKFHVIHTTVRKDTATC
jgi:hypothetical protein